MKSKTYTKILTNWSWKNIVAQKSQGDDNHRIAVRSGLDEYILSNPVASGITMLKFMKLETDLRWAEKEKKPITIQFIKKFGKKFIQEVN